MSVDDVASDAAVPDLDHPARALATGHAAEQKWHFHVFKSGDLREQIEALEYEDGLQEFGKSPLLETPNRPVGLAPISLVNGSAGGLVPAGAGDRGGGA